jgi:alpha-tubulin suppressor-like RCC1 family protein
VEVWKNTGKRRLTDGRAAIALAVLGALVAVAVLLPASSPAGQSSQATATPVAQVAAGLYHSCAMVANGATPPAAGLPVRCWGFSGNGQVGYGNTNIIGDNETPGSAGPVDLGAGRTAKALANGDYHSCAVLDNGTVRCWGYGNEGQLGLFSRDHVGDNETPGSKPPVNLGAGRTATAITAGGNHTCALLDNGIVRCWGLGEYGQLGNGGTGSIGDTEDPGLANPVDLGGGHTATAVTAGAFHTCAIRDDGAVSCWGLGGNGQLGNGSTAAVLDPSQTGTVNLGGGRTAKAITAGFGHTCAILDDGTVRCWGLSDVGQLGYGNKVQIGDNEAPGSVGPVNLGPGRTATAISSGGDHTCAVLDDGSVRCWGSGLYGQLGNLSVNAIGDNETPDSVAPVDLGPGRKATAVVSGIYHSCARIDDGSVRCWGNGEQGRLGLCSITNIGDDEAPASVGQVDLGAGGQACPTRPTPTPGGGGGGNTSPPVATISEEEKALQAEKSRAAQFSNCYGAVTARGRKARRRALRRYRRGTRARKRALRRASRRTARGRSRCVRSFGRKPGRVTTLAAKAGNKGKIILTFRAPGSDGSSLPPARNYVIKQSFRPIRSRRQFRRALALCKGECSFPVTKRNASITLNVTGLHRRTRYYYSVAARDNVSKRLGARSKTAGAKTR